MWKKRMEGLLIALCIALLLISPGISLSEGSEGFTYELLDDGTACIMSCSLNGNIRIPETINGRTVTALNNKLFYGRRDVKSVFVPASVTRLGRYADKTEDNTFAYVFSYCYGLEKIEVDNANPALRSVDGVLYSKDLKILYNYPCGKTANTYTIREETNELDCTSLASCNIKTLYIEGYDVVWRGYTFYNDSQMTVYYKSGGGTGSRVMLDYAYQQTSEYGPWPTFVEYGTPKPEEDEYGENEMGVPTEVKAVRTSKGLKISWKASRNTDIYYVKKQRGGALLLQTPYGTTTETSFVDEDFTWGTMDVYRFYIEAVKLDANGKAIDRHRGKPVIYMSFPVVKHVTGKNTGSGTVTLKWDLIETTQSDMGYEIWYSNDDREPSAEQEPIIRIKDIKQAQATIDNLDPGTWKFYVRPYKRQTGISELLYLHELWSKPATVKIEEKVDQKTSDGAIYKLNHENHTAVLIGIENVSSLIIPDTVKANGTKYKVTAIADNACKGTQKLESVVIGKNVKSIGQGAFHECGKLEKITIKTKLLTGKTVGKNAFEGIYWKVKIKCPSSKLKAYKTILSGKGAPKKAKFTK